MHVRWQRQILVGVEHGTQPITGGDARTEGDRRVQLGEPEVDRTRAQDHLMIIDGHDLTVGGSQDRGAFRREDVGAQMDGGNLGRPVAGSQRQPRTGPGDAEAVDEGACDGTPRSGRLGPARSREQWGSDREVETRDIRRQIDHRARRAPAGDGPSKVSGVPADGAPQDRLGEREGHRGRPVQDEPVQRLLLAGVRVVGIGGEDVVNTHGQHGGPSNHQRPERGDLGLGQRGLGVETGDYGGGVQHRRTAVPDQQRGDRGGQIGDQPSADDVAEVDHPGRAQPTDVIAGRDHVVVGQVGVHDLDPQLVGQRVQCVPGAGTEIDHRRPAVRVGHRADQGVHHSRRVAAVVLQVAVRRRVLEVGQGTAQAGRQRAEATQHLVAEIAGVGEHVALDEGQQPDVMIHTVDRHDDQVGPAARDHR